MGSSDLIKQANKGLFLHLFEQSSLLLKSSNMFSILYLSSDFMLPKFLIL